MKTCVNNCVYKNVYDGVIHKKAMIFQWLYFYTNYYRQNNIRKYLKITKAFRDMVFSFKNNKNSFVEWLHSCNTL